MITSGDPSFFDLLPGAVSRGGDEVDLLIDAMPPDQVALLRVCSIPHYCDAEILETMLPEQDKPTIRAGWRALCSLATAETVSPIVGQNPTFRISDRYRRRLLGDWLRTSSDDPFRFRELNKRAADYWRSLTPENTRQADRLRREIVYHEIGAAPGDGIALLEQACRAYLVREQSADAGALLTYASELKAALDPDLLDRIDILEASVLEATGQREQARIVYESALSRSHGSAARIKLLLSLAAIDADEGMPDRAENLYRQVLALLENQPESAGPDERIAAFLGLSAALLRTGSSTEARGVLQRALTERVPAPSAARVHLELGLLLREDGQFEAAIVEFQEALRELAGTPEQELEAGARRELGLTLERMSDWAGAEQAFQSSLLLFDRVGNTMAYAQVLADLARVSWHQKKLPEAARRADEASGAFERVRADAHAGLAQLQAARVLTKLRQRDQARRAYKEAERLLQTSGAVELLGIVKDELSSLTRTRRLLGWAFGLVGLSGVASLISTLEVEHLYFTITSILFVLYGAATQLQRLAMAAIDAARSIPIISDPLVILIGGLILCALFVAAVARKQQRWRVEEYFGAAAWLGNTLRAAYSPFSKPLSRNDTEQDSTSNPFDAALKDAELLLKYAAETGVEVPNHIIEPILLANTADQADTVTNPSRAAFYTAYSQLTKLLSDVTADTIRYSTSPETRRTFYRTRIVATGLMILVAACSVVTFVAGSLSNGISQDIASANAAAAMLWASLTPIGTNITIDPSYATGDPCQLGDTPPKDAARTLQSTRDVAELQSLVSTVRDLRGKAIALNRFVLHPAHDSTPVEREGINRQLELNPAIPDFTAQALCKIKIYQLVRTFASTVRTDYAAIIGAFASYALPILYALLGAYAYRLRLYGESIRKRTYHPSFRASARMITAMVGGVVVGLFSPNQGQALSPLAIAFVVGYSVELLLKFLDLLIITFGPPSVTGRRSPT